MKGRCNMKVMISQPMNGLTDEEIKAVREEVIKVINPEWKVLNTLFDVEFDNPIYYLAKSIEKLAEADVVIFVPGWEKARGCKIEYEIAKAYGKFILIMGT
jgi:putative uncharacterized protein (fragment)|nr:MAG TPA: deoxyribosyltransferase [Caudoviricetes sp.]